MRIKLDQRWSNRLRDLPESGMGYQRVNILFANGRELKNAVVLNAQELELPEEIARTKIKTQTVVRWMLDENENGLRDITKCCGSPE